MTGVSEAIARNWWTLDRFGLTPRKLPRRLAHGDAPKVLCVCIPKAGTHLLERALCLHPRLYRKVLPTISGANLDRYRGLDTLLSRLRPGQIIVSHLRFDPAFREISERRGVKGLFLIRDPHDMVVSKAFFVTRETKHQQHGLFAERLDVKEKIRLAIEGDPEHDVVSIGDRLRYYDGWLDSGFLTVRFEDLVGVEGGGDPAIQEAAVKSIFDHLGIDLDEAGLSTISARVFSQKSPTFRKGAIGQWRQLFDPELKELFDRVTGEELDRYGYRRTAEERQ